MKKSKDIIAMLADVEIQAAEREGDKTAPRRFTVNAYNGGKLSVDRYPLPVVVDLSGLELAKSITANLHHDRRQLVGHVESANNDGKSLVLAGRVSGTGPGAREFADNHDNGFPWQASIEAMPSKVTEVPKGKTLKVNGQTFTGPIIIATKSKLYGIAFLTRGADEETTVSIAASAAKEIDMQLSKWINAMGFDPAELTEKQMAKLEEKYDAEVNAADDSNGDELPDISAAEFDLDDIKAAYSEHMADLEVKFAEHEGELDAKKFAKIKASGLKAARELKANAIEQRWAAARFEVEAIKAASAVELELVRAERPTGPAVHASTRDVEGAAIEAALCMTLGMPNLDQHFEEKTLDTASQFRSLGLQETFIMAAQANGYTGRPAVTPGNLREVLRYALPPIEAAGMSSYSLSGILSNVANKELLMGFETEDQSWREIAAIKTVTDFKQVTSYRMLDDMEYAEVGPDGKIQHGEVDEESYTRQAKTYAKMFTLTRTAIINDDLGAFDDVRTRLGKGAAIKFNKVFWAKFINNSSFFTAGRTNYITGATTVLDSTGLSLGVKAFRQRTGTEGNRIGGTPRILLVPPETEADADELYVSRNINTGGSSTKTKVPNRNTHEGKYRPVVSAFLSDSDYTGYSATAWYLLQDPAVMATIAVSFLNGVQMPTIESADADFDQLGVQFRGYHDFGADLAEWTAGIKSKGAA